MEPIQNASGKVRGAEILYFEHAELEKVKGGSTSFASFGALSVLYFKDYNRYVLHLNDWKYPLLRRLPILGVDRKNAESRSYSFPALNGFAYNLRIHKKEGSFALHNLDEIFEYNSRMTWKDKDQAFRKAEESPDDHLVRHLKVDHTTPGITEAIKEGIHNIKHKIETLKTGTKNVTSKKKKVNLKDIKTKNYRKRTHSKLNKSFFKSHEKDTSEFWQARRGNLNNIVSRKYDDIRKLSSGPSLYFWREELENAILNNKDIAVQGLSHFNLALQKDKLSDFEASWSQASTEPNSVTQSIIGQGPMESHSKREPRSNLKPESELIPDKLAESLLHYQG